jgi:hypothetical protein
MKCYWLATLAVALTVASFAAHAAMAQNALSADQKTEMTPKIAEMLMMAEMGPSSGNGSMGMMGGGHHDMGDMPGMQGMGGMSGMGGMGEMNGTHKMGGMHGMDHGSMGAMGMSGHMGAMSLHMAWSDTRPETDADRKRAEQIAETLKKSLAKYNDYHVAEQAGYKPFHPEFKQRMVHFTRNWYAIKAAFTFNPSEPTSLLYRPLPDGGYELIGAMYTAPRRMSEEKLDERVPLSVARWHQHVNLCFPPKDRMARADWTKFGFNGTIATEAACEAAGGRFFPVIFGWMVHVYPWETDQTKIWAH